MAKQYKFMVSPAYQLLNACPSCHGDALFVVGLSDGWRCLDCDIKVDISQDIEDDASTLAPYREFVEKLN